MPLIALPLLICFLTSTSLVVLTTLVVVVLMSSVELCCFVVDVVCVSSVVLISLPTTSSTHEPHSISPKPEASSIPIFCTEAMKSGPCASNSFVL